MKKVKIIIVIDDKKEELMLARKSINAKIQAEDDHWLGVEIDDFSDVYAFDMVRGKVESVVIHFARNLTEAEMAITSAKKRIAENFPFTIHIMTDLIFPVTKGGTLQVNGISVVLDAVQDMIPIVVCSDTDHHEIGFLPKLCQHLKMANPDIKLDLVLDNKNWDEAVDLIFS